MIVGFYGRVSTEEQRERQTIAAQLEAVRSRAKAEGWDLREYLDDGVSGTLPLSKRPAGARLLADCRARGIQLVVAYKVDRLARKARLVLQVIEELDAVGVPFRSLVEPFDTETPAGRLFMQMLASFAEFDRASFLERSMAGTNRVAKQSGRWLGGIVPYGYRKRADMTLEVDEQEAQIIRQIFELCAVSGWSTNRIAVELNARLIPTAYARDRREFLSGEILGTRAPKEGKRRRTTAGVWHPGAVLRILKNETYAGRHVYGKRSPRVARERVVREMPAIVAPSTFERVRRVLAQHNRWDRAHPKRDYLLRGLLTCECGHALIGQVYRGKAGAETRVYRCASHPKGPAVRVLESEASAVLWGDALAFLAHPSATMRAIIRGRESAAQHEDDAEKQLMRLATDLRSVDERDRRALEAHVRGLAPERAYIAVRDELAEERARIERGMARLRDARAAAAREEHETIELRRTLGLMASRAKNASPALRSRILRALVGRTRVSWIEDGRTRLDVVYRFDRPEPDEALVAMTAIDNDSVHGRNDLVLARTHVLDGPRVSSR